MSGSLPEKRREQFERLVVSCQAHASSVCGEDFRELYEALKDRVYHVCYRLTGSESDALDAAQETFQTVFRRIGDFRFESRFTSWVYRIAVNASIDIRRRGRIAVPLDPLLDEASDTNDFTVPGDERQETPSSAASKHELEVVVQGAIDRLSPKLRSVTVLRYLEGLTYAEVAEALSLSLGTVKSRLARAHDALSLKLERFESRSG